VLSDEVYDFLSFDGRKHVPFASVGDNWRRTVSIYSGGKLFSATGWKLGWCVGPESIIKMGGIISNTVFYCSNTPA
jgi:kynurenine aminotransferase